jgi:hypothetical protein
MKASEFEVILDKYTQELKFTIRFTEYIQPIVRDYFMNCLSTLKLQVMIDVIDLQIEELESENLELIKKLQN